MTQNRVKLDSPQAWGEAMRRYCLETAHDDCSTPEDQQEFEDTIEGEIVAVLIPPKVKSLDPSQSPPESPHHTEDESD